jgi:hypothetical protein
MGRLPPFLEGFVVFFQLTSPAPAYWGHLDPKPASSLHEMGPKPGLPLRLQSSLLI